MMLKYAELDIYDHEIINKMRRTLDDAERENKVVTAFMLNEYEYKSLLIVGRHQKLWKMTDKDIADKHNKYDITLFDISVYSE
jgi:hypothetical protein